MFRNGFAGKIAANFWFPGRQPRLDGRNRLRTDGFFAGPDLLAAVQPARR